ncbi:cationic amino acid transporter 2, vacuolar isoform X1 [Senna tora]|uniref:Cationic amino acid transporter 2, vacuolar isoform X1 n=1 Tax=Senna tora TaxID=362788 RepID=A0A834SWS8_9FABA|nr:cationic amino acid transporter 2, vacuolar isoform X1 [Senna tora]
MSAWRWSCSPATAMETAWTDGRLRVAVLLLVARHIKRPLLVETEIPLLDEQDLAVQVALTEDDRFYIGQMAIVPMTFGRYVPILSDKHAFVVNFPLRLMECSGSAAVLFAYIGFDVVLFAYIGEKSIVGLMPYYAINPDTPISSHCISSHSIVDINKHSQVPVKSTIATGLVAAILAFLMDVSQLAGMLVWVRFLYSPWTIGEGRTIDYWCTMCFEESFAKVRMLSSCAPAMAVVVIEAAVLPPCPDDRFYIGQMAIVPMTFGRHVPILSDKDDRFYIGQMGIVPMTFGRYVPILSDRVRMSQSVHVVNVS